ncbi:MAG: hypothetical protein HY901_00170 [Deltaproteobacteria bacterium]|nr:hypothetical protein [Deltaproteobacteria bacterium]
MSLLALALSLLLTADPTLKPVVVPEALLKVTAAPELSGLAWSSTLDRFLVVVDDTGRRDLGTAHTPLVLSLAPSGTLDETPVPISGISSLNDAESITPGPDGTFFLTTSHSPNKRGRTPASRRQLLHLALRGRALAVLGRLDLTGDDEASKLLRIARLPEGAASLDIEALAFHEGALFIGLKSPLTVEGGAAVILRLANPVAALREGRIPHDALTRWAALPLRLPLDGKAVCQGLSDMVFLADGSLVASSNVPKGSALDPGGALWWLPSPAKPSSPVLLHHFLGLKPEGVALAPSGSKLVVVFDRGAEEPRWAELPLPAAPLLAPSAGTPP